MTKRELAAILRESVFAPNKPGPLKVIMDVGDSRYYMQRALELILLSLKSPTDEQKLDYLGQAITLLAMAKHSIRTPEYQERQKILKEHGPVATDLGKHKMLTQKEIDIGG